MTWFFVCTSFEGDNNLIAGAKQADTPPADAGAIAVLPAAIPLNDNAGPPAVEGAGDPVAPFLAPEPPPLPQPDLKKNLNIPAH